MAQAKKKKIPRLRILVGSLNAECHSPRAGGLTPSCRNEVMALWLEPGAEAVTPEAQADLDALSALRESAAIELKEKGNEYVKMGKKYYKDAIDCYTRAIEQKSMDAVSTSVLFANRAQVHLLLGNNRRALIDAQHAIELNKANIKNIFCTSGFECQKDPHYMMY